MIFMLIGRWKAQDFQEYVGRAERTLAEHADGYSDVTILDRYYSIGERSFFVIAEADSGEALMGVVAPYLDLCDVEAVPVLNGPDALDVWLKK
jgi:hypothetical protein